MRRFILPFLLACTICSVVFVTLNDFGISWDEPIYFSKGNEYIKWFRQPKLSTINTHWEANLKDIHPPLRPFISSTVKYVLTDTFHLLDDTRAYRFSTLFFVFAGIFLIMYYARLRYGTFVGIFCGIGLLLTPQMFYLSNISSLDFPITIMWFVTVLSVLLFRPSVRQAVISGILIGISMLIKFNGIFLFIPIIGYMIVTASSKKRMKSVLLSFLVILISLCTFLLVWPWFWTNPIGNLMTFLQLQTGHAGPSVFFMGTLHKSGPWYYPIVMFLISTPLILILPTLLGSFVSIKKGTHEERFLFFNTLYPFSLILLIPAKYDGIRLILPAYPFIVLLAGIGIKTLLQTKKRFIRLLLIFFVSGMVCISIYTCFIRIHPYEQAYYNELVGGIKGAKQRGFETDYWGSPNLNILPWMNANKDKKFCVFPTTNPFYYYLAMGYLESGVTFNAAPEECDELIISMRQGYIYQYPKLSKLVTSEPPDYSVSVDSVPLVSAYAFPKNALEIFVKKTEIGK